MFSLLSFFQIQSFILVIFTSYLFIFQSLLLLSLYSRLMFIDSKSDIQYIFIFKESFLLDVTSSGLCYSCLNSWSVIRESTRLSCSTKDHYAKNVNVVCLTLCCIVLTTLCGIASQALRLIDKLFIEIFPLQAAEECPSSVA